MSDADEATISYRLGRLEEDVRQLRDLKPEVLAERVIHLATTTRELKEDIDSAMAESRSDVKGLRQAIIGAALSVTLAAIGIIFTFSQAYG